MGESGTKAGDAKIRADIEILAEFVKTWCGGKHPHDEKSPVFAGGIAGLYLNNTGALLCEQCRELLVYGAVMRIICPHDPKPACRKCPDRCYRPGYREKIREVMKYSGKALIRRGRMDLLFKYIFH